jgi:hypothetical protein
LELQGFAQTEISEGYVLKPCSLKEGYLQTVQMIPYKLFSLWDTADMLDGSGALF